MKKILSTAVLSCAFALCLVLVGCGGGNSSATATNDQQDNAAQTSNEPSGDQQSIAADVQETPADETLEEAASPVEAAPQEAIENASGLQEDGRYRHEVGGAVFYTYTDMYKYLSGDAASGYTLDFRKMCEDFGQVRCDLERDSSEIPMSSFDTNDPYNFRIGTRIDASTDKQVTSFTIVVCDDPESVTQNSSVYIIEENTERYIKINEAYPSTYMSSLDMVALILYGLERAIENPDIPPYGGLDFSYGYAVNNGTWT